MKIYGVNVSNENIAITIKDKFAVKQPYFIVDNKLKNFKGSDFFQLTHLNKNV
jgi:hypothetical protein